MRQNRPVTLKGCKTKSRTLLVPADLVGEKPPELRRWEAGHDLPENGRLPDTGRAGQEQSVHSGDSGDSLFSDSPGDAAGATGADSSALATPWYIAN